MGYRSDVRIVISKKGYKKMLKYMEEFAKRKDLDKDDIIDLLNCTDISFENKYQRYFGWDGIKWYDGFPDVDAITEALSYIENEGYSYKFTRIGEELTDIEEYGCDGDKDTKKNLNVDFPYIARSFDDLFMENEMKEQDKIIEKLKDGNER